MSKILYTLMWFKIFDMSNMFDTHAHADSSGKNAVWPIVPDKEDPSAAEFDCRYKNRVAPGVEDKAPADALLLGA